MTNCQDGEYKMKLEDYNEYYIQGSEHYLIPKAVFIELYEEMTNFREESREYKEVIDTLEFIKARAKAGATQETINKLVINFVNSYIK